MLSLYKLTRYIIKHKRHGYEILKLINQKIYAKSSPDCITLNINNKYFIQLKKGLSLINVWIILHNCRYSDINLKIPLYKKEDIEIRLTDSIFGDSSIIYNNLNDYKKKIYTKYLPSKYCSHFQIIQYHHNKPIWYSASQIGYPRHKLHMTFKNNKMHTIVIYNNVDQKRYLYVKV